MRIRGASATICVGLVVASCSGGPTQKNLPWSLVRSAPSASTVVVEAFGGACDVVDGARVVRSGNAVVITVRSQCADTEQADMAVTTLLRVRLGGPLGNRTVKGACVPGRDAGCDPSTASRVPAHLQVFGP